MLVLITFLKLIQPHKAAVILSVHGGGYILGAGTMEEIMPSPLVAVGGVIVVAFNYRIGALGFLSTSEYLQYYFLNYYRLILTVIFWVEDENIDWSGT